MGALAGVEYRRPDGGRGVTTDPTPHFQKDRRDAPPACLFHITGDERRLHMTIAAGHHARITAVLSYSNQATIMNVFDVVVTAPPVGGDEDLSFMIDAADWLDQAYTPLAGDYASTVTFVEVRGYDVTADAPLPAVGWPNLTVGEATAEVNALGVAALVLFRTAAARVIGRKFIGPVLVNAIDETLIISSVITHLVSFGIVIGAGIHNGPNDTQATFGIMDKFAALHTVTDIIASSIPAYQRRRKQLRGI